MSPGSASFGGRLQRCTHQHLTRSRGCNRKVLLVWISLLLMAQLPQLAAKELQQFLCSLYNIRIACQAEVERNLPAFEESGEPFCKGEPDGLFCWPSAHPQSIVNLSCPREFYTTNGTVFRLCLNNGSWLLDPETGQTALQHSCADGMSDLQDVEEKFDENVKADAALLSGLTLTYNVGYTISLILLVGALIILTFFKKLHCTRNYVHMNLMISFIFRYTVILVKDKVLVAPYESFNDDPRELTDEELFEYCSPNPACRLTMTMMHYAVLCNYFWLLIEGVYLQSILSFAMTEQGHFPHYMALGWGGPWIPTLTWVMLRYYLENVGCWEMLENRGVWWAIQGPVILTIVINFGIFINILRIIINKLRANNMARNDYKYRLARSTLALIPLLGIHYIVFLFVTDEVEDDASPEFFVKLAFEMVFTSFQGAMVAILYCFMTSEVQTELHKLLANWKWRQGLPSIHVPARKLSTFQSNGGQTQLTTYNQNSMSNHQTRASLSNDGIALTQNHAESNKPEIRRSSGSSSGAASSGDSAYDSAPRRPLVKSSDLSSGHAGQRNMCHEEEFANVDETRRLRDDTDDLM